MIDRKPWRCPDCHKMHAPHVDHCDCRPPAQIGIAPMTGPLTPSTGTTTITTTDRKGWTVVYTAPSSPISIYATAIENSLIRAIQRYNTAQ